MRIFVVIIFFLFSGVVTGSLVSCNPSKATAASKSEQQAHSTLITGESNPQHRANPYPVIPQKDFTRVWSGLKKCNNGKDESASTLTIASRDSANVFLSGFFSAGDSVVGKVRGYMVIIQHQSIRSIAVDNAIEGSFVLSNDHNTLKGFLTTQLNGHVDSCSAVYHLPQ